jgi:superfamily II DNA or RNA helicase
LLLLSATPHRGKTDAFRRVMSLIDERTFSDESSIVRDRVEPYVIRTEKREAIDREGAPLFTRRETRLQKVEWTREHKRQRALYEAVTEYVREGYNQAMQEKKHYLGFLMILMQRMVSSSTRAIASALERRLQVLQSPDEQMTLIPEYELEALQELDGETQAQHLLQTRLRALGNEMHEVRLLHDAAQEAEATERDAKAEALLEQIYRLQQEESDPDLKVLIFTEFVATQDMLQEFFQERGFSVVCLNGSMGLEERQDAQHAFAEDARILISTDAGGEGINLQFCHVVVNYDLPWNPMKLEQRIGRVDRIGQDHAVMAMNLVLRDTVERRVREVLEEKLAVILRDFGVDKTGDVLDSVEAESIFDDVFVDSIAAPDRVEENVDSALEEIRRRVGDANAQRELFKRDDELDPDEVRRVIEHPLPQWTERMVCSYLDVHGGEAKQRGDIWELNWPDGSGMNDVVFDGRLAARNPSLQHLTLENDLVRELVEGLPGFVPGQPIPVIGIDSLPSQVAGVWSLWRVSLATGDWARCRFQPLFMHDDGRLLAPTAHSIWDQLNAHRPNVKDLVCGSTAVEQYETVMDAGASRCRDLYDEMIEKHGEMLQREQSRMEYSYEARRKMIDRIGLAAVRAHRLAELQQERKDAQKRLDEKAEAVPDLTLVLVARVEGGHEDD